MKTVIFAAVAAAAFATPAFAHEEAPFTGPRAGVTVGYDSFLDQDGVSYGVAVGYDLPVASKITAGVEATLSDSSVDFDELKASRDIAASLRLGYVATPNVLLFGKVGYASSRLEVEGDGISFEGVRFGGGVEYAVRPNVYISAEYARTQYEQDLGGRDAGVVGIGFRF